MSRRLGIARFATSREATRYSWSAFLSIVENTSRTMSLNLSQQTEAYK
jgi:hypothetical protein